MALAAEDSRSRSNKELGLPIASLATAIAVMAVAANCLLKYMWWAACYSASFYERSVVTLELASIVLVYLAISFKHVNLSRSLRAGLRIAISLILTIAGTGLLALALAWVKQSH